MACVSSHTAGNLLAVAGPGTETAESPQVSKSAAEFVLVAVPKVLGAGIQLFVNVLLLRVLGPEISGVLFVCISSVLLGDAVLGSALDLAVLRLATGRNPADGQSALAVQKAAVLLKLAGCVTFGLLAGPFARPISRIVFHSEAYSGLLFLSLAALFGLLLLRSVQTCFQVSRRFLLYGTTDLCHTALKFGGVGLIAVATSLTPAIVLTLYAAAPIVVAIAMILFAGKDVLTTPLHRGDVIRLLQLFKWYVGGAATGSVTSRMDLFLLSAFAGSRQAGVFSAAQTMIVPFQLLGMYLGVVFAPRVMPLWETGRLSSVYARFQTAIALLSVVCYVLAVAVGSAIISRIVPASFSGTSTLVFILLPSSLTSLINFPWTVSFLMFTHPRFLMCFDACALLILGVVYWQAVERYGAAGAAAVTSLFAIFKTCVLQVLAVVTMKRGLLRTGQVSCLNSNETLVT